MSRNQWFMINDLDSFIDHARTLVFKFFGETNEIAEDSMSAALARLSNIDIEEMDKHLSFDESAIIIKNLAKKDIHRKTKEIRYCITDKILTNIIEALNSRMISNILNKLVNDGVLDSAYDNEKNDFVFWVKEDEDKKKQDS